jgi:hypothetical protein
MLSARHAQASRIAQLGERPDGVVSQLIASRPRFASGGGDVCPTNPKSASLASNDLSILTRSLLGQGENITHMLEAEKPSLALPFRAPLLQHPVVAANNNRGFESAETSSQSDDELLNNFRDNLARQVPFVSIPVNMNALELSRERPCLYRAIVTVASYHDSVHQIDLGHQFVEYVTANVVLQGKKTMDLLQGLLIYITWFESPT